MRGRCSRISLRSCGLQVCAALSALCGGQLPLCRERPEHALDQRGIAIFLDLLDLAVLDAPDHAIVVVVAFARPGDIITARFDHDVVTLRDEVERQRAWPHGEERSEVT